MKHRIALITAGSLAGVVLAGGAAVAVSLGILDASASSEVGNLSAATAVVTPASDLADLDPGEARTYQVGDAGTVTVTHTTSGIAVTDVNPAPGWTPSTRQVDPETVVVELTGRSTTIRFTATATAAGIDARVDDVGGATATPTPSSTTSSVTPPSSTYHDDDDDEHGDDEHGDDHEEHEEYEYEGRDWDD